MDPWDERPPRPFPFLVLVPPLTFALVALGFYLGSRIALPLLEAVPAWVAMVRLLRERRRASAVALMMIWGVSLGASLTFLSYRYPMASWKAIWHGEEYASEMVHWVDTGEGSESRPRIFVPQHALHLAIYAFLCLISASFLGILMGALLMGYMSCYVATLARSSQRPLLASLLGWHFWSVVRVASFILLGVLLAEPLLSRIARYDPRYGRRRLLFALACAGILLDVALKTVGAEPLRHVLRELVAPESRYLP